MIRDGVLHARPRAQVLDPQARQDIHLAALRILERTGVLVHEPSAREMLHGFGCQITPEEHVRIPEFLVEDAIRSAPSSVTVYDRNGRPAMELGSRKSFWGTGSDTPFVLDSATGERRPTRLDDIRAASVLVDRFEHFDFLMCMGVAHELPQHLADKHHFLTMASNTTKPLVFTASSLGNLRDIHAMAAAVAGDEEKLRRAPFAVHYTEPIAPLVHPRESVEKLLYCVGAGIPVIYSSATTMGQNGPMHLAGCLALSVARILSGLVIAQCARRGAPVIVTMHVSSMDMRSGVHTYASPEHILGQAAGREMADLYGLPTFGRAGTSDSKLPDEQAAFEAGQEILMHALTGENLIHDVGYLESGLTASWDLMAMANEQIGAVKRVAAGFDIDAATLSLDAIHDAGPAGNFLAHEDTARCYRDEVWLPELWDRSMFAEWKEAGGTTLLDRARSQVLDILAHHESPSLNETTLKTLRDLADRDNREHRSTT